MPTTKKRAAKRGGVSEKQRASDDELRERLRTADLRKFDRVLKKAISGAPEKSR